MADYNINLTLQSIWETSRLFIDVIIMWFVIYYAIKFVRNNARTIQIFKGIVLILAINGIAKVIGLETVAYFSDTFINWGFLAVIIIFQPELRGMLERIGKSNAFTRISGLLSNEKEKLVEEVYRAVTVLSDEKVGALISIEQSQSMQDYIKTGITINSAVTKELLTSIFITTTPLHDGAVIIQGDKIACASAYFPPTNAELPSRYGARHRAALGISEVTDALTIVVSEETSAISIAEKGKIFAVDERQLKNYLRKVICNDEIEISEKSKQHKSLFIIDDAEMEIEKEDEVENHNLFTNFFKSNKPRREKHLSKEDLKEESDMKMPRNNRRKYTKDYTPEKENIPTTEDAAIKEDDVIEIKDNITNGNGGKDDEQA